MKTLLYSLMLVLASITQLSAQKKADNISETKFAVSGICEMCKARIEKAALYTKGVKSAVWSIEKQEIVVVFKNDKTSPEAIAKNIAAAGHDNQFGKADPKAYEDLHGCCKYKSQNSH